MRAPRKTRCSLVNNLPSAPPAVSFSYVSAIKMLSLDYTRAVCVAKKLLLFCQESTVRKEAEGSAGLNVRSVNARVQDVYIFKDVNE